MRELVVRISVKKSLRDIHGVIDGVVQDRSTKLLRNQLRVRVQHLQDVSTCNSFIVLTFVMLTSVNGEPRLFHNYNVRDALANMRRKVHAVFKYI